MEILSGFKPLREQALPELNSTAQFYRHAKTGTELLSIVNDDENKMFGVTFRTPPRNSTGVAHIGPQCAEFEDDRRRGHNCCHPRRRYRWRRGFFRLSIGPTDLISALWVQLSQKLSQSAPPRKGG